MLEYSVLVGAAINVAGAAAYIRDTASGKTRPNLASFILWALAPLIAAAAAFAHGETWTAVPVLTNGLLSLCIVIVALKSHHALWKIRPFDYVCAVFSALALILWGVTHEPNIAIFFAILSDFLAAVPTLHKSWTHPETETPAAYVASLLAALTSFLAAKDYSFAAIAFPSYLVAIGLTFLALLWRRPIVTGFMTLRSRHSGGRGCDIP